MNTKKILKVIVTVTVVLSSVFQAQPTFANEVTDILYDVKFELNGGSGFFPTQTVSHGNLAKMPLEEPVRTDYLFIGWFTDANEPFDFSVPIVAHTTIHARWEPRSILSRFITVNFELNGGMSAPEFTSQTVRFARRATRPTIDPIRAGYTFTGWFTLATGGIPFNFDARINTLASSLSIHAQWERIVAVSHAVSFELNGGIHTSDFNSQLVPDRKYATRPTIDPIRAGYTFTGWFTYCHEPFNFSTPIVEQTVIHARWELNATASHVVSFELNGGNVTPDFASQVIYYPGRAINPVTIPIRDGYIFTSWMTSRNGGYEFNFDVPVTRNTTLYAQWEPNLNSNNDPGHNSNNNSNNHSGHNSSNNTNNDSGNDSNNHSNNNSSGGFGNQSSTSPDSSTHLNENESDLPDASMKVDDEGTIIITAPHLEGIAIKIFGARLPFDATMGGVGELGEIFILFPGDTEPEELDVVVPIEWTYDYFHDVPGNLVLALLPPGVDLATVLSNPSNPQPRDRSMIEDLEQETSEQTEEPVEDEPSEYALKPPSVKEERAFSSMRLQYASLTQHASLPNSLALVGGVMLKSGHWLLASKKELNET